MAEYSNQSNGSTTKTNQVKIFTEALGKLPEKEKEIERFTDEAFVVMMAGGETTARALSSLVYHVVSNPRILSGLQQELDSAIPDLSQETPLTKLEALPYLVSNPFQHRDTYKPRLTWLRQQ